MTATGSAAVVDPGLPGGCGVGPADARGGCSGRRGPLCRDGECSVSQQYEPAVPPRGWNSYDCYGCAITEGDFRANVEAMAAKLRGYGYVYAVIDGLWYYDEVTPTALAAESTLKPRLDGFGRPIPSPVRFPSSAGGAGFKPLADFVHGLGLKFGIHVMRGIPREAVAQRMQIEGTGLRADEVADTRSVCAWERTMFGVEMSRPGAQGWYESLLRLYAGWGVDFIKGDDFGNAPYHRDEVTALHRAVKGCGREMVLSLSPGIDAHEVLRVHPHVAQHCDMWRISADIWDKWDNVKYLFGLCSAWSGAIGPVSFPDADMLPYGMMGLGNTPTRPTRRSRLTEDEVRTHFTLLAIARSPLMFGGDVPQLDDFTLGVLTNPEVLAVNSHSRNNRPVWLWDLEGHRVAWRAEEVSGAGFFLAVFNLGDEAAEVSVGLEGNGFPGRVSVRDLWGRRELGVMEKAIAPRLPPHGCALYRCAAV